MRHLVALVVCTVGAIGGLVWPSATPAGAIQADVALAGAVRGMTISTPRGGRDWGPDAMVGTIAKVKALGSNWIAIHPYVGIDRNSRVGWRRRDGDLTEAPAWLTRPIAEAHRQGVKILIKPHLAHWRTGFSWRGEIKFDTDEAWAHLRRQLDGVRAGAVLGRLGSRRHSGVLSAHRGAGRRAAAERPQEQCLQAALQAIAAEPAVRGAFLWKWFPGERRPRNFAMSRPAI